MGLFIFALIVRLLYLIETAGNPTFRFPLVDAETYHTIARQLAESGQFSEGFFWQPFLYPFVLSIIYKLSGSSILIAKVAQAMLGGLTCVLTYSLGRRIFDRRIGLIAAVIVALYGPLVFFECDLVAAGMAAFWSLVLILVMLEFRNHPRLWLPFAFGFLGAAAVLTRPTYLPFVLAGSIWMMIVAYRRSGSRTLAAGLLLVIVGFTIPSLPVAMVNQKSGLGQFTILPFSGGLNFYIGNNPDVCTTLTARPGWEWTELTTLPYREGIEDRSRHQAFFYDQVRSYAANDPSSFLSNLVLKTLRFLNARELPRNVDSYLFRQWSHVIGGLLWKVGKFGFPFGLLLPLAVVGGWHARRRIPAAVWLFLVLYSLSVIAVFVADRYRVVIIPVVAILAAAGVSGFIEIARLRRWRRLGIAGVLFAVALLLSCLPGPFCEERPDYQAELDYLLGLSYSQQSRRVADEQEALESIESATMHFERALERRKEFADAWSELGNLLFRQASYEPAMKCYMLALHFRPNHGKAMHNKGILLMMSGKSAEAFEAFEEASRLDPSFSRSYHWMGKALASEGRPAEAIDAYLEGIRRDSTPSFRAEAHALIADALSDLGRFAEAVEEYRVALLLDPRCTGALKGLDRMSAIEP